MSSYKIIEQEKEAYLEALPDPDPEWPTDVTVVYKALKDQLFEMDLRIGETLEDAGYCNNNISTKFRHFVGKAPKASAIPDRDREAPPGTPLFPAR